MRLFVLLGLALLVPATAWAQTSSSNAFASQPGITVVEIQPPPPGSVESTSRLTQDATGPSGDAPLPQLLSLPNQLLSNKITFSLPHGTAVSTQYQSEGIIFGGGAQVSRDDSSGSSPVLTGTPPFDPAQGSITGLFVEPGTNNPLPVSMLVFDIGYLDQSGSIKFEYFNPQGAPLFTRTSSGTGFFRYVIRGGNIGIGSFRISVVSEDESNGFGIDNVFFTIPGFADLGREMGESSCPLGNPVNPAVGNKYQVETDYQGGKPFPLKVARTYNSLNGSWQFLPELDFNAGSVENVAVRPDGKRLTFATFGSSSWVPSSPNVTGTFVTRFDSNNAPIGWRFTTLDDHVEDYDLAGRIASVTNRSGISHAYTYSDNTIAVTHSLGGSVVYAIDLTGRITGFTDPGGKSYTYSYNTGGLITAVNYPNGGGSRIYHYGEGGVDLDLLTGITDANGDRFATWTYNSDRRATSSEHNGGAERVMFDYTNVNHPSLPNTRVTNALGKDTIYNYIEVNGHREIWAVNGQPSTHCVAANQAYGYDSRAFIASKTDWKGNVTAYVRDSKGQELTRTEAKGTPQERTITTTWHATYHLPTKITEPGRETTFIYDSSGNLKDTLVVDTTP